MTGATDHSTQVSASGAPFVDLAHVVQCLAKVCFHAVLLLGGVADGARRKRIVLATAREVICETAHRHRETEREKVCDAIAHETERLLSDVTIEKAIMVIRTRRERAE